MTVERRRRQLHVHKSRLGNNGSFTVLHVDATSAIPLASVPRNVNKKDTMTIWMQHIRIKRKEKLTKTTYECSDVTPFCVVVFLHAVPIDSVGEGSRKKYLRL